MKVTPATYFQRQTTLSDFGEVGQQKLQAVEVVVIGCGGLGCVAAVYLASSGIGAIHLVDFDEVSISNLHRQVFYKVDDVGVNKAKVLAKHIEAVSPFTKVTISQQAIEKDNIEDVLTKGSIILDCTDSLPIKYLINDACVLNDKTLVYGSLYKHDGYVATFNHLVAGNRTANLRDAFPEMPTDHIPNCSEIGTLNPIVGIIGLMQANEVLKLAAEIGNPIVNELLIYNSLDNSQFKMKLKSKFNKEKIEDLFFESDYIDENCALSDVEKISQEAFKILLNDKPEQLKILAILPNINLNIPFEVDEKVLLSSFEQWVENKELEGVYVVVCQHGITSANVGNVLLQKFPKLKVISLEKGISGFH